MLIWSFERFTVRWTDLPELHAYGAVQLHQTCLQVHRLAFRVVQVDSSALVVVALDLTQVHTQIVTQLAKFCFTSILKAELECCRKDDQILFTAFSMLHLVCYI